MRSLRFSVAGLMILVLAVSFGFVSLRTASEPSAAIILLLTLGILSLAILAVVYRRGARRASWLGFALLGWGYMMLASGLWWDRSANRAEVCTTMFLDWLYPHLQPTSNPEASLSFFSRLLGDRDPRNALILSKLDQAIAMSFPNETPLEDILKYIKTATQGPNDNGIPIYVDPQGLQKARKTLTSPVVIDLEGMPLRTTLTLALRQLGLTYTVDGGLLAITQGSPAPKVAESFRLIGHCYWALLAGWIGWIAGRFFYTTRHAAPEQ